MNALEHVRLWVLAVLEQLFASPAVVADGSAPSRSDRGSQPRTDAGAGGVDSSSLSSLAGAFSEKVKRDRFAAASAALAGAFAESARGPRGWLGLLVAHGVQCQAFEMRYMNDHGHLLPMMRAVRNMGSLKDKAQTDWHYWTLMVNRFVEWQCPCWMYQFAPLFESNGYSHENLPNAFYSNGGQVSKRAWEDELHLVVDTKGREGVLSWSKRVYPIHNRPLNPNDPLPRPAHNIATWAEHVATRKHQSAGKQIARMVELSKLRAGRRLSVPPYWNTTDKRRRAWAERLNRWFEVARWMVWAGEMLRLHSADGKCFAPDWWRDHALSWGIGVPSLEQQLGLTAAGPHSSGHRRRLYTADNTNLALPLDAAVVYDILRQLVRHTPVPGSVEADGRQIVPGDVNEYGQALHGRYLCDLPAEAGSLNPAWDVPTWTHLSIARWLQTVSTFDVWLDAVWPALSAVAQIVVGGGAGVIGVSEAVMRSVTLAIQVAGKLSGDERFWKEAGDIVGYVGRAVHALEDVGDFASLSDTMWRELTTSGVSLASIAGDEARAAVAALQTRVTALRDAYGWNYIEEAFGGAGLTSEALGKFEGDDIIN